MLTLLDVMFLVNGLYSVYGKAIYIIAFLITDIDSFVSKQGKTKTVHRWNHNQSSSPMDVQLGSNSVEMEQDSPNHPTLSSSLFPSQ